MKTLYEARVDSVHHVGTLTYTLPVIEPITLDTKQEAKDVIVNAIMPVRLALVDQLQTQGNDRKTALFRSKVIVTDGYGVWIACLTLDGITLFMGQVADCRVG